MAEFIVIVLSAALLLGKTAQCQATPHHSRTFMPLLGAIDAGNVSEVHRLLNKGANPNEVGTFYDDGLASETPLNYAVTVLTACGGDKMRRTHVFAICKDLVRYGAKIDQRGDWGQTPLMISAQLPDTDVLHYLLDHGAQINTCDDYKETPLMWAVSYNRPAPSFPSAQAATFLLQRRASVNLRNTYGETALMKLAQHLPQEPEHAMVDRAATAVAHSLLSHGANPWLRDNKGATALDLAKNNAMPHLSALLQQAMHNRPLGDHSMAQPRKRRTTQKLRI